ncbi:hypothetical protein D043_2878B, partial [Vibrio parahaemolyticus EKP-021]
SALCALEKEGFQCIVLLRGEF